MEEQNVFFSVIVVCYNAGEKLKETIGNILSQTCEDYEIIVKDGGSEDGSLQKLPQNKRIRVFAQKDKGIYDAMNQAAEMARGQFVVFMNCGDYFHSRETLEQVKTFILQREISEQNIREQGLHGREPKNVRQELQSVQKSAQQDGQRSAQKSARQEGRHSAQKSVQQNGQHGTQRKSSVYYGNILEKTSGQIVVSNPRMDDFACFRNVPNHQACYYSRELLTERGFDLSLRVRADYEHFLWCRYRGGAELISMPFTVADYEGGGFSETAGNRRISAKEHRKITEEYLPGWKCMLFRAYLLLSLQPLREKIAQNPRTASAYDALKNGIYRLMGRNNKKK